MRPVVVPFTLILCATPRVGSTLAGALLASSGVAGIPESWYRAISRAAFAKGWGLRPGPDGQIDPAAYLCAARAAGRTANGVGALRIQAPTLAPLLAELCVLFPDATSDRFLFERAFGPCRYLHIWREDLVAQAVSRLRAEQSGIWHLDDTPPDQPATAPAYDANRIASYLAEAEAGNAMWRHWFAANRLVPQTLTYEALAQAPVASVQSILQALGLAAPAVLLHAPNQRLADQTNADWAARFRAERG